MEVLRVVLLGLAMAFLLLGVVGALAARTPYDRVHLSAPAGIFPPVLLALAVVLDEGPFSQAGLKAVLTAVLLLALAPMLAHATGRAAWVRTEGALLRAPSAGASEREAP